MATTVVMEALSPTMEEGRLVEWKLPEGATVAVGDVLAEVETDKAVMELVARVDGTLLKHLAPAGATVPVADPVGIIGEPGEDISGIGSGAAVDSSAAAKPVAAAETVTAPAAPDTPAVSVAPTAAVPAGPAGRIKASPLARRIAQERGIDLAQVSGSGPGGRVA